MYIGLLPWHGVQSASSGAGAIPVGVSHDLRLLKSLRRVDQRLYGHDRSLLNLHE
jgi:hypothetical protein